MSKKTTTLSFRIDSALKDELMKRSEAQEETITDTARDLLIESLSLQKTQSKSDIVRHSVEELGRNLDKALTEYDVNFRNVVKQYQINQLQLEQQKREHEALKVTTQSLITELNNIIPTLPKAPHALIYSILILSVISNGFLFFLVCNSVLFS